MAKDNNSGTSTSTVSLREIVCSRDPAGRSSGLSRVLPLQNLVKKAAQSLETSSWRVAIDFKSSAARLLSAALAAFVITVVLIVLAALYAWYKDVHYPEGIVSRSLEVGTIMFPVLTGAILWECRNEL